jgi:hypothetical protein
MTVEETMMVKRLWSMSHLCVYRRKKTGEDEDNSD